MADHPPPVSHGITVEPTEEATLGPCSCCGGTTQRAWGFLRKDGQPHGAYFVRWTAGSVDQHGAWLDLVLGGWGEGTATQDRVAFSVEFRRTPSGSGFMIKDAAEQFGNWPSLAGRALNRDEVVGTPLAGHVYAVLDAIWLQDRRLRELSGG